MFEMYVHFGTYFKVSTILFCAFLYAPSIYYSYDVFTILCDDDVVLFIYM